MAPSRDEGRVGAALARLDEITRLLRRECPWDREQDERSIVPHTVEEAYELADAAESGDDERLLDELGDVLFQVYFLALLLEERGKGDLAAVADHCREKLIRRHPHVFGEREAATAGDVVRNWQEIKREDEQGGRPVRAPPGDAAVDDLRQEDPEASESAGYDWTRRGPTAPGERLLASASRRRSRRGRPGAQPARRREQVQGGGRMSEIQAVHGPADRGQPRESHCRGGCGARLRRGGARRGALGRLDRRVRGGGAARRRRRPGTARAWAGRSTT